MWKQEKLLSQLEEVRAIKDLVVVSGGLAWHLMSPPHIESKKIHDHSDVDLFVFPNKTQEAISVMKQRGFNKYWTKYDKFSTHFYRYGTHRELNGKHVKILIDLFVKEVPFVKIDEFHVIEHKYLLSLYGKIHASSKCIAVRSARILTMRGINPIGRKELLEEPAEL